MKATVGNVPVYKIKTKKMQPRGFDIIDLAGKGSLEYNSSEPHRHSFFELFVFTGGSGRHEVDFNEFDIIPNSVHFVSPGQIHQLTLKRTTGHVLCFSEDFISLKSMESVVETFPFYDSVHLPLMQLKKDTASEITSIVQAIARENSSANKDLDVIRSYLNIILLRLKALFYEQKGDLADGGNKKQKVILFKKAINDHFLQHLHVSAYAGKLNVSPNHLNALCKKHEGRTATQLIQERMLLESKRLLYATEMNIKEISFHLNFEDVPYFNRFFKKQTRLTPLGYRERSHKDR